ncbi:hypothetical protein JQ594_18765 [Bradyrhizobium manausense]|uniref:hypothetical protein n=1 Tax=Bradyrhizobium manausense TaxID=989370 RepID=UPI001BADBE36|nr:hypothetical protein [Bradyrhizobium manausense]MBR0687976.1 hypothetical protein [Bradyrhizobium manausense]
MLARLERDVEKTRLSGWDGPLVALEAPAKQYGFVGKACHAIVASCKIAQAPQSRVILAKKPLVIAPHHAVDCTFTQSGQLLLKLG